MIGEEHDPVSDRAYVSPHEFARLSGLSVPTIRRYVKSGRIAARQPAGRHGRILIPISALEDLTTRVPVAGSPDAYFVTPKQQRATGPRPKWMG